MDYTELVFTVVTSDDFTRDLFIQDLSDLGFESFEDWDLGFKAYINRIEFKEPALRQLISVYPAIAVSYEINEIESINWNLEWEKNYQPVVVSDQVYIRASFHEPRPEFPLNLLIEPKMAFGTGHHDTTSQMAEYLLETEVTGKKILDMGCGSGILAILAEKLGALEVLAVDIDDICTLSTRENAELNHCTHISVQTGDIDSLSGISSGAFEVILANINRNILLSHMDRYFTLLAPGGVLLMSGFYETPDLEIIAARATELGFSFIAHRERNKWAAAKFTK